MDPRAGLDGPGDLLVRDGEIAEVGAPGSLQAPEGAETVDAEGLHALPAFVDPHVHLRTPGREDEEDIETGTRAAAAGGYCQILAMPNTDPVVDSASIIQSLRERAREEARIPTGFTAAITRGQSGSDLTEMAELADAGAAAFTDDGLPVRDAGVLRQALQYQRLAGRTIALHEEDPTLSGAGVMHEGAVSALLGMAGIPSVSESTMIARDCALAAYEEARIHVQHLSAVESVQAVAGAKAAGVRITAEASPHHLLLDHTRVAGFDPVNKVNPPLRAPDDVEALRLALADGVIDCVATDHAPHAPQDKDCEWAAARPGMLGLQTALSIVAQAMVHTGLLDWRGVAAVLSERPAAIGGLPDQGRPIAEGEPATLTLVDPDATWTVRGTELASPASNTPYEGMKLPATVVTTVLRGRITAHDGEVLP